MTRRRQLFSPSLVLAAAALLAAGCETKPDAFKSALPQLPPEGGAVVAAAGRLTGANFATESIPGPASQGLAGDFFIRNDVARFVVQAPGRAIGPCPYGGNVIDADFVASPRGDQLGEVSPFLQLGRTLNALSAEVVRDGSRGGPAVLRFYGRDAWDDFINLRGLGTFTSIIEPNALPQVELGWEIAVTYILYPGETQLHVFYTFYNPTAADAKTSWGTITDTGARIEIFHPGTGFGETGLDAILGANTANPVQYLGLQGQDVAFGVVPIFADQSIGGAAVPVAGVDAEVYDVTALFEAFGDDGKSLAVKSHAATSREIAFVLGRDLGDVTAQALKRRGETTLLLTGTTTPGARVAVTRGTSVVTALTADASGHFATSLPQGAYTLQAEGEGLARSPAMDVTLPADAMLSIPSVVSVRYQIHDRAGQAIPAKIVALGARPNEPSPFFRDVTKDGLPHGMVTWAHTLTGVSTDHPDPVSGADRPLRLLPGTYRFVVSRGPEWSRDEQVITVGADTVVDATLDHVVPTPGYAACDFHQHTNRSPDSPVPPEARVLSYVAEGVDFASTSDHDYIFDLKPIIDAVGATGLLDTAPGIETTTWDYGHYIGFPLVPDPTSPNHGALDWAGGENINGGGLNLPPPVLFDKLHEAGAKVVQVNHPRASKGALSDFQQSFDRVGLRFDYAMHTFYGDASLMPLDAELLALPPDVPLFSPTFDTLEVFNGFHPLTVEGERLDEKSERVLRDWMSFLSFGFAPTPTGVSDTHTWISDAAGMPRTLVAVPDDSPAAVASGLLEQVVATILGASGTARDVVVTNGPFMKFTVGGEGIGRTVTSPGPLAIHVESHSPVWAPVDTVEVFANTSFDIPGNDDPLVPALCFTTKATPSARCAAAVGGARPLTEVLVQTVTGVPSSTRRDIVVDVSVSPDDLLAQARPGGTGKDLWLVARVSGTRAMYPSVPNAVGKATIASIIAGTPILDEGVPPLAFTNAIFVDVDGGGWRAPFAP